jgi:hypothetical protein
MTHRWMSQYSKLIVLVQHLKRNLAARRRPWHHLSNWRSSLIAQRERYLRTILQAWESASLSSLGSFAMPGRHLLSKTVAKNFALVIGLASSRLRPVHWEKPEWPGERRFALPELLDSME